jgi:hypothetical protein
MISVPSKEAVRIPSDVLEPLCESKPVAGERLDGWKAGKRLQPICDAPFAASRDGSG